MLSPTAFFSIIVISVVLNDKRASAATINPERAQLLKDALGWMTFRKNGQLMTDTELEPLFLQHLKKRYEDSLFYATLVIAFHNGVVPRLTLNLNDPCDLPSTMKYKDPLNNSVTWHYQKQFIFESLDNIRSDTTQYCDYRQGLICKFATRKCGCPDGSKMESIVGGTPPLTRCLVQKDQVCSLIDIDHGNDPKQTVLVHNIHRLIFNMEKPLGCQTGTQCRFKPTNLKTPLCYDVNSSPWAPPYKDSAGNDQQTWKIGFGSECALDLYADPGACRVDGVIGYLPGYVCYNFGPPRFQSQNTEMRTGFCSHEVGRFGFVNGWIGNEQKNYHTFFHPFIHPRSVPLREQEFEDYMQKMFDLTPRLGTHGTRGQLVVFHENERCSIQKTKQWEDMWKWFSNLDKDPPPGREFVSEATKLKLNAKLQEYLDLNNTASSMCTVYVNFRRSGIGGSREKDDSMKCESSYPTDSKGNDGKCKIPGNLDTLEFAEMAQRVRDSMAIAEFAETTEHPEKYWRFDYRKDIIRQFPEEGSVTCPVNPSQSPVCSIGKVCYKDYNDEGGIYVQGTSCDFKETTPYLRDYCHDSSDSLGYGACEGKILDGILSEEFEKLVEYSNLGRGDPCPYQDEKDIRDWIEYGSSGHNKYKMLALLLQARLSGGTFGGFCDRTRLLKCTENGALEPTCECIKDFEPRKVSIGGKEILSDYCYSPSAFCKQIDDVTIYNRPLTMSEKKRILSHYGNMCTNICVYLQDDNTWSNWCTKKPTGMTGYDLKPEPTTTTTNTEGSKTTKKTSGGAGGSGYRFAGEAQNLRGSWVIIRWSLLACGSVFIAL